MTDLIKLPAWQEPQSLDEAATSILGLSRSVAENSYIIGKHLRWAKQEAGHGGFLAWLREHVRLFSERTARRLMEFSERCDGAGTLQEYRPRQISDTVADLNRPALPEGPSLEEAERLARRLRVLKYGLMGFKLNAELGFPGADKEVLEGIIEEMDCIIAEAREIKAKCEVRTAALETELTDFFGFPVTAADAPMIIELCQQCINELRQA